MLIALQTIGGWLVKALVTPFLWMWAGAQWAARRQAEHSKKVKDGQLDAALDRPANRDELVDRLRRDGRF